MRLLLRVIFSFGLGITCCERLAAQSSSPLDSLLHIVQADSHDSATADALYELAIEFLATDLAQADSFADLSLTLSREIRYGIGEAKALGAKAYAQQDGGNYLKALESYEASKQVSLRIRDSIGIQQMEQNIGTVHAQMGNYPLALEHFLSALRISRFMRDEYGEANALSTIGSIHKEQHEFDLALRNYADARRLFEKTGNTTGMAAVDNNVAGILNAQGDKSGAMAMLHRALDRHLGLGHAIDAQRVRGNIAMLHFEMGAIDSALVEGERALREATADGNRFTAGYAALVLGKGNAAREHYPLAISFLDRAITEGEATGSYYLLSQAYHGRAQVDSARGDYKSAYESHKRYMAANDSLYNEEKTRSITQQRLTYDFEKKEASAQAEQEKRDAVAAEELRRKNLQRNFFIGGFGLMVLLAGVFFLQRNRISMEKARSEELLLNILPEEVAEELKAKGSAEAVHIDQVTVLFTDFKGFTAMSEMLSAQDLVRDLNECFSAFDHITAKYGIEKIKTIGDAYMAAGGLPTPNNTHATDVVLAALEMRDFIAEGKARKINTSLPYFEIRIGIHTGPVVAGIVGVKKFAYDIWGDTVNTASRMESSGEVGQVNISEATYALVKDEPGLAFTPRGKVQAKGKGEIEMYFAAREDEQIIS